MDNIHYYIYIYRNISELFETKSREAIEIQYYQTGPRDGGMNQDDGNYMTTSFWKPMLQYVKTKTLH